MKTTDIEVTTRARAFSGEGVREHLFTVDAERVVRVWDSVAGHFTTCHSLSESAQSRIRELAETAVLEAGWKVALKEIAAGEVEPLEDLKIAE